MNKKADLMNDYMTTLLSIKETVGEIKSDIKLLQQDHAELKQYLKTEVRPVVDTIQKVQWLGHKFIWALGFITLGSSVYAAIQSWK